MSMWRARTCGPDGCRRADDRLGIVQPVVDEVAQAQPVHQQLVAVLVALATRNSAVSVLWRVECVALRECMASMAVILVMQSMLTQ